MKFRWYSAFLVACFALVVMLALPAPAHAQSSGGQVHIVRRGETLSGIAVRYGVSMSALAQANSISNPNRIFAGMRLWVPGRGTAPAPSPKPGTGSGGGAYVVRRGDTLSGIARAYGVSVAALMRTNGLSNANRIIVGQRLAIPSGSGAPAPAPAPGGGSSAYKWIEVDLSAQRLIAHEGDAVVLNTAVSTGLARTPTPVGRYAVRTKVRSQTMSGPGYRLPNVQWVMYFVGAYALHGTYWHNNFGHPMSHGCVNLTNADARFLYNWASHGTEVVVHR